MCLISYLTVLVLMSTIMCFDTTTITWHDEVYTITGPTTLTWNSKGTTTNKSVRSTRVGSYYYSVTTPVRTTSGSTVLYRDSSSTYVDSSRSSTFVVIEKSTSKTSSIPFISSVSLSYSSSHNSQSSSSSSSVSSSPSKTTSTIPSTILVLTSSSSVPSLDSGSSKTSSYSSLDSAHSNRASSSTYTSSSRTASSTSSSSFVLTSSSSILSLVSSSSISSSSTLSSFPSSFHSTSLVQYNSPNTPSLSSVLDTPSSSFISSMSPLSSPSTLLVQSSSYTIPSLSSSLIYSGSTSILSGGPLYSCPYNMISTYDSTKSVPTTIIVQSRTYIVPTYTVLTFVTTKSGCQIPTSYEKASSPVLSRSTPINFTSQASVSTIYGTTSNPITTSSTLTLIVSFSAVKSFTTTNREIDSSASSIGSYPRGPLTATVSSGTSSSSVFSSATSGTKYFTKVLSDREVSSAESTSRPIPTLSSFIKSNLQSSDLFSNSSVLPLSLQTNVMWTTRTYSTVVTTAQDSGQFTITTLLTLTTAEPCYLSSVSTGINPTRPTATEPFTGTSTTSSTIDNTNSRSTGLSIISPSTTRLITGPISKHSATIESISPSKVVQSSIWGHTSGPITSLITNEPTTGLSVTGYHSKPNTMEPTYSSPTIVGTTELIVPSTTLDRITIPTTSASLLPSLSAASVSPYTSSISSYSIPLVINQAVRHTFGGAVVVALFALL